MITYTNKSLVLTLFIFFFGVFGGPSGYALKIKNESQKLQADDCQQQVCIFGESVSIYGDTVVIGARRDDENGNTSGSAYVFVRDAMGVWREQQKLTDIDGAQGDEFGISVSIFGGTAVIGAGDHDNGPRSGSVTVFVRDGAGVWSKQQKLTASDAAAEDRFGSSVSLYGDTAVIGAYLDGNRSGSAYVFVRDGAGVWSEQQKLNASDAAERDVFGESVSISGDTVVIGSTGSSLIDAGSAYVFVHNGTGIWRERQILLASDGERFDRFGHSVSIDGDTIVIGAKGDDDNGSQSGSAYVFVRDGVGVWREQQKLTASDGTSPDVFGHSVSLSGDTIVIGAYQDDVTSGSAYIFVRDGTGVWHEQQKLLASDGAAKDYFGWSVSIDADTAMIGANRDNFSSGSAYVFEAGDPGNNLLKIEKRINYRLRETVDQAAQLLAGTRYRADYNVTNNSPNRIYGVQVFESAKLICNLYALDPGESKRSRRCAQNQPVLSGIKNVPATVTAKVSGSNQTLVGQGDAYYTGHSNVSGELRVTHYVNEKNADTQVSAVDVNSNQAEVKFRVENTGPIELYRVRLYHDPASPINSGWQELCYKGTLMPGEVRYCKRPISVTEAGLNKAFGRAQGLNANISATEYVNAANPTYFNVVLPLP